MEYFFNQLDYETKIRLQSTQILKLRGLVSSDFKLRIPLEPIRGSEYKALVIKPNAPPEKLLVGLLWHAMFGKYFKVYHWLILFNLTVKTLQADSSEALVLILILTSTGNPGTSWEQNSQPVRKVLQRLAPEKKEEILQWILSKLPYTLPKKDPKIESFFTVKRELVNIRRPKVPNRIGVGYKDKGSLPKGKRPDLSSSEFLFDLEDRFFLLVRRLKHKYPFLKS